MGRGLRRGSKRKRTTRRRSMSSTAAAHHFCTTYAIFFKFLILIKCLDDLEKHFAKCKVNRSEPIVPFRETLVNPPKVDELGENFGEQQKKFMEKFKVKFSIFFFQKKKIFFSSRNLETVKMRKLTEPTIGKL